MLAFEEEKRVSLLSLPSCLSMSSPAIAGRVFFSSLWLFLIQIRMSRAQFWSVQLFLKKKVSFHVFSNLFLFVDSSSQHYPPELCDVSRAALWLDRGRACAGAWVALRMNREYAQGTANEQLV